MEVGERVRESINGNVSYNDDANHDYDEADDDDYDDDDDDGGGGGGLADVHLQ